MPRSCAVNPIRARFVAVTCWLCAALTASAATESPRRTDPAADPALAAALAAEAAHDTARALELFLALEPSRPNDPFVLQKIARQYSDSIEDLRDPAAKRRYAEQALAYSERATALAPNDPVNVLSIAISLGKLSLTADNRTKVAHSKRIKELAERALALDPDYAWAHHVLGRWHHEVTELGAAARFVVGVFYGRFAPASFAEAVRHFAQAVELEPHELAHHAELGISLLASGDKTGALTALKHALSLPPRAKHDAAALARARAALARLSPTTPAP